MQEGATLYLQKQKREKSCKWRAGHDKLSYEI